MTDPDDDPQHYPIPNPPFKSFIREALTGHWGKRCRDFEPYCVVCRAWREYDDLVKTKKGGKQ